MMPLDARLRLVGDTTSSATKQFVADLARAGLTVDLATTRPPGASPQVPYLLAFGRLTGEVLEELEDAGGWGDQQVLAIALSNAALKTTDTWLLLRSGASDVVRWDDRHPPTREIAARVERWEEVHRMLYSGAVRETLIGDSPNWLRLLRQVVEVAAFTETSVLLTGESGTGKELVARVIHALDRRPDKGLLVVADCTTVVPTLSGSEFFGHERGAFTG